MGSVIMATSPAPSTTAPAATKSSTSATRSTTTQTKKSQKSRNGCLTCKKKRLKCDETKPACLNCQNKKIECGGYSTNFRWKSFEETTTSQKLLKKPKPQTSPAASTASEPVDPPAKTPTSTTTATDPTPEPRQNATTMNRSYSMPEQSVTGFDAALQQAALSIAGRSPEELAKQTELMAQGKNPFGRESRRNSSVSGTSNYGKRLAEEAAEYQQHMNYSMNIHSFTTDQDQQQQQQNKRRQTVSVLDQPVMSPGASSMGSPSLSTLVRAFTEFDSINVPQSPSNIDPLSPVPRILEISRETGSAIEDDQQQDGESLDGNQIVMCHMPKRSLSMDSALSSSSIPQYRKELLSFSQSLSHTRTPIQPSPSSTSIHIPMQTPHPLNNIPKVFVPASDFEKVFQAFDKYTCAIMSIKDGPTENPWRTLVWPLALQHSVLFKSLASMSLFHVARGDESLRKLGVSYMRQSMNELAEGLVNQNIPNDVALATCLTLAITDSWEKHTTTGIAHLKGARSIINKLDRQEIAQNEPLYKFLINVFLYYDVLARMSSLQATDTDYDENGKLIQNLKRLRGSSDHTSDGSPSSNESSAKHDSPVSEKGSNGTSGSPDFGELFGHSIFPSSLQNDRYQDESIIDPLLGCAPSLFLIIGRVASFIAKVRNMHKLSLSTVSTAVQLKTDLASWRPDPHIRETIKLEDPLCDVSSCIATAEAYRYSSLLYLQQAVPEIASQSSNDLAEKVLMLLASIPTSSKTCIVHMFPLLVASCEMTSAEDREWVKDRWRLLADKMWLGTIDRSVEIVEEVWRRKDVLAARAKEQQAQLQKQQENSSKNGSVGLAAGQDETWDMIQDRIDALTRTRKREDQGINSWAHWSTVTKEWNWEVLFG